MGGFSEVWNFSQVSPVFFIEVLPLVQYDDYSKFNNEILGDAMVDSKLKNLEGLDKDDQRLRSSV